MFRSLGIGLVLLAGLLIGCSDLEPPTKCDVELTRIAEGRSTSKITQMVFEGAGYRIICDDPETLAYFQTLLQGRMLPQMPQAGDQPYRSYVGHVELDHECIANMPLYISPPDGEMKVIFWEGGMTGDTYRLTIQDPPPGFKVLQTLLLQSDADFGNQREVRLSEILKEQEKGEAEEDGAIE